MMGEKDRSRERGVEGKKRRMRGRRMEAGRGEKGQKAIVTIFPLCFDFMRV